MESTSKYRRVKTNLINNWQSVFICKKIQIDFIQAFPQAPVEREIYMEIPRDFKIKDTIDQKKYVLKINKNIYGEVQEGKVWYEYLTSILLTIGFTK